MDEYGEFVKRASLLAAYEAGYQVTTKANIKTVEENDDELERSPPDRYHLVHIVAYFIGLASLIPASFFLTANSYWMYKFRDPANETVSSTNRTLLQANFASATGIAQAVPGVLTTIIASRYAHKIRVRVRLLTTSILIFTGFVVTTIFVVIDTDSWQYGFFVMTICIMVFVNINFSIYQISLMVFLSKFPQKYMKTIMIGQGGAGIFNASLQIMSVAIGNSAIQTAIIYFTGGSCIIFITLLILYSSKNIKLFRYYARGDTEDTKKPPPTWAQMKPVLKAIWPCLGMFALFMGGMMLYNPIFNLVVSEYHETGSEWNKKFFVPVVTFFFGELISLVGRAIARPILTRKTAKWILTFNAVRVILLFPFLLFCNAYPRTLPVVFKQDWQYIIILAITCFTNGYFFACGFLSLRNLAENENREIAYLLLQVFGGLLGVALSPLALIVNLM